jgi:hypothetical protein
MLAVASRPFLDNFEHISVRFITRVSNRRMVQHARHIIEDLVNWYVGVVPCIHNPGSDILKNGCGDLTGRLVQNIGEMVLGEHGVCGIGAVRVCPDFELMFCCRFHNS